MFRLKIPPGQKQLPLPLKHDLNNTPIFRRSRNNINGVIISDQEALPDSTLRLRMAKLGRITGIEQQTGPYTFRRGNGEALDTSSKIRDFL